MKILVSAANEALNWNATENSRLFADLCALSRELFIIHEFKIVINTNISKVNRPLNFKFNLFKTIP